MHLKKFHSLPKQSLPSALRKHQINCSTCSENTLSIMSIVIFCTVSPRVSFLRKIISSRSCSDILKKSKKRNKILNIQPDTGYCIYQAGYPSIQSFIFEKNPFEQTHQSIIFLILVQNLSSYHNSWLSGNLPVIW